MQAGRGFILFWIGKPSRDVGLIKTAFLKMSKWVIQYISQQIHP